MVITKKLLDLDYHEKLSAEVYKEFELRPLQSHSFYTPSLKFRIINYFFSVITHLFFPCFMTGYESTV